ncbi:short chain dehydrogenase [Cordyceps militaris CM01]|uniref:Short chain dehydrogenase n=1 Tax=Cordyceps militaris (strain CM01) TaxID=983644 RepID=G3JIH0_CORMM|nr:short chain dehydrogenase [Cordyceps militaris CM01]EGX91071.1 short chain dehydrogenase [Cordyceps militaris CM01]
MEVFGLKSQSLRYRMDGLGSVQLYLTPPDYFDLSPSPAPHRHLHAAAAMFTPVRQKTTLVVGASRGIGQELVQQLAQQQPDGHVIASVRSGAVSDGGRPLPSNVRSLTLDPSSGKSVREAAGSVGALDTLIVHAAVEGPDEARLLGTSDERMAEYMDVGVTGVLRVVKAFLPALRARPTRQIVLVSSTSGPPARQGDDTRPAAAAASRGGPYAVSRAALNMVAVQLHNELHGSDGFTVVPIHPGGGATDTGRIAGEGGLSVAKSAAGILKVVGKLTPQNSATFYNYDGTTLPG